MTPGIRRRGRRAWTGPGPRCEGVAGMIMDGIIPYAKLAGKADLEGGKVPSEQLPSYVDEVAEAYIVGSTPYASDWLSLSEGGTALTPEEGVIYYVLSAGDYQYSSYRWGGTAYVLCNSPDAIQKVTNATAGDIPALTADGALADSGQPVDALVQAAAAMAGTKPLSAYPRASGNINTSGTWLGVGGTTYYHAAIPVTAGDTVRARANSAQNLQLAFVKTYTAPTASGGAPDYSAATGYTTVITVPKGTTGTYTVPSDATYVIVGLFYSSRDMTPDALLVNGYDITKTVAEHIAALWAAVNG